MKTAKPFVVFVLFVVLTGAGWALWAWWFADERTIKRRLHEVAETLSLASHDSDLARLSRLVRMRVYLAEDIRIQWGASREVVSREAVLAAAGRWVPPPSGILVEFVDVEVDLAEDANSAQVRLIARVSGVDALSGEPTLDANDVHLAMVKREGTWVIASANAVEVVAYGEARQSALRGGGGSDSSMPVIIHRPPVCPVSTARCICT
jgi:hypothetical protein